MIYFVTPRFIILMKNIDTYYIKKKSHLDRYIPEIQFRN